MMIGLETYDKDIIQKINTDSDIEGAVLGDLYCQKRMFENDVYDMYEYMIRLKACGKKVIFQTPRYITDRNMEQEMEKVRFLIRKEMADAVIVQDIGVASEIMEACPQAELIWGRMGYNRNPVANRSFFEFLKKFHVTAVETADEQRRHIFEQMGFKVYKTVGTLRYSTVNRECYFLYQNDIFDQKCGRACIWRKQELIQKGGVIRMTVDGYMLGRRYEYPSAEKAGEQRKNCIVYGEKYEDIFKWVKRF